MRAETSRVTGVWLLVLSYAGFISLGLPDTVLGAAWPAVRSDFRLPVDAAGAAMLVTTGGVVLSSTLSSRVRVRWGTSAVLVGSTALAAIALFGNAAAPSFTIMLLAALVAGLGGGAIDACLNDYVARNHSARHMNWLHACWGVGASIAPAVVSTVLAAGASWRLAYALLGAVELLLVFAFWATRGSWRSEPESASHGASSSAAGSSWPRRASVLMFFCYGGLESGAGLWAATLLTETRGSSRAFAGAAVAVYWGALCAGRFIIGARADAWEPTRVLRWSAAAVLGATVAFAIPNTPPWFMVGALGALGIALASIYPLTMHDTPRRFGAAQGARLVGYQVAAASLGIASLPWLIGAIAVATTLSALPVLLCVLAVGVTFLERARR